MENTRITREGLHHQYNRFAKARGDADQVYVTRCSRWTKLRGGERADKMKGGGRVVDSFRGRAM
jgi:hypothetical protein